VALGALLYLFLTFIAYRVYDPLGLTPSEVGLGYTSLLVGAALASVFVIWASLWFVAVVLSVSWLAAQVGRWWWLIAAVAALIPLLLLIFVNPIAAAFGCALPLAALAGGGLKDSWFSVIAALGVMFVVASVAWNLYSGASSARDDLKHGRAFSYGYFTSPWSAKVVRWIGLRPRHRASRV
jgi:hypothetical protein